MLPEDREPVKLVMMLNQFPKFSETFIVNKFLGLRARGWDVSVICNRSDPEQWDHFPQLGTREANAGLVYVRPETSAVLDVLKSLQPKVVHFEFGNLALGRTDLPSQVGAASVVSFRGPDLTFVWRDQPGCYDEVWEAVDGVHVLGADLWRRALQLGCPEDVAHAFIHPAIDTDYFDPGARHHAESIGSSDRPLRVLSVGRVHWVKGYPYNLQAVRTLVDRGLHCEYRILGGHDHREHLLEVLFAIDELGLGDVVQVHGRQSGATVKDAMLWADALLHGAVSEGFCNAVIEAQAMALPVVCSDADGLPENVSDGHTGFVVPRRDAAAAADRLARLAADPGLRQHMGEAGRVRAVSEFRLERQLDAFERLYAMVLESASERAQLARLHRKLEQREKRLAALTAELAEVRSAPAAEHGLLRAS